MIFGAQTMLRLDPKARCRSDPFAAEDNPVALRLKELETLERVAERIDKISVFGGLDQVLNGLVKLR